MNRDNFINYLNSININLNDTQLTQLTIYCELLLEYNKHTNLTAIKSTNDVYLKHFLDSILLIKYFQFKGTEKVLDIGTGAGFPGVILKILFPKMDITLLDSNNKKIKFLQELVDKLELKKINLVNDRVENFVKNNREDFDIVTSRAVANLNTLAEISIPLVKLHGYFLPMKGNVSEELINASNAINILGGKLIKKIDYLLPIENSNRTILVIEHIKTTNPLYPRVYDKIIKKPL